MLRRVITLLVAVLLLAGLTSAPANAAYIASPTFNVPVSPKVSERAALPRKIIWAINNTPRGGTIRIASYSFDRKDVADALIDAYHRRVNVQIVLNDNWTSTQTLRLRKALGSGPSNPSFVRICEGNCRGSGAGNLHIKVYLFSQAGSNQRLMYFGSANMTDRAVQLQWNDLVTLRNAPELYMETVKVFNQLKYDRPASPEWIYFDQEPGMTAQYYRTAEGQQPRVYTRTPSASEDPVMNRLKAVDCTAPAGYGINGHTAIRIMMYGWNGDRGVWLANQVAELEHQGCDIKVITSVAGGQVIKILRDAGVPVRSADYKYITNADGTKTVDFYSHLKVMALSGTYNRAPAKVVWTGSENWSGLSFMNDELTVGMWDANAVQTYFDRFAYMNQKYTHRFGIYPTTKPAYVG
ncbi:phospholipase D-like domain-containing protein [Nocardioides jiangxiensis]|uniref:phospholipase D n=1 Tax=Nocardioides jiangxiensis TaxID=3064524 RepID=A0ABT9B2R2_9ACTN|nr:phospholipase D-like domain-containing protein [Nocardioides sp. WY-20]MDO7867453.1 phospholipase D-like domain-containing protein [Nocardioides sp. WY-20]